MAGKPPGIKVLRGLLDSDDIAKLRGQCHSLPAPTGNPLFRLFGDFGDNKATEEVRPWMVEWGQRMYAERRFRELPNQYRVCNWLGEHSAQFKWHIDSKRHGEEILVISLTDGRKIGFRPPGRPEHTWVLELAAGDGYFMRGAARWSWDHCVLPSGAGRSGGESFILAYRRTQ
ncbi:MAG: hypothetical protein R3A51_08660 [Nannocystaceae bacterium]